MNPWPMIGDLIGWIIYGSVLLIGIVLALGFLALVLLIIVSTLQQLRGKTPDPTTAKITLLPKLRRDKTADDGQVVLPTGQTPPGGAPRPPSA